MRRLSNLFIIFIVLCIHLSTEAKILSDKSISKQFKQLITKENALPNSLKVSTINSVVYITGSVDTQLQKNLILELVSNINDVININTEDLDVTISSAFFADALITAKVKGRIKYLELNKNIKEHYNLNVETTNSIVHIVGIAQNNNDICTIKTSIKNISSIEAIRLSIKIPNNNQ